MSCFKADIEVLWLVEHLFKLYSVLCMPPCYNGTFEAYLLVNLVMNLKWLRTSSNVWRKYVIRFIFSVVCWKCPCIAFVSYIWFTLKFYCDITLWEVLFASKSSVCQLWIHMHMYKRLLMPLSYMLASSCELEQKLTALNFSGWYVELGLQFQPLPKQVHRIPLDGSNV